MRRQPIRTDVPEHQPYGPEHDACALYVSARKQGQSTFGTLKRALGALSNMGHRTGYVNGEGDGAGVQTDIPRQLWAKKLSRSGIRTSLATSPGFWVGHLLVPHDADYRTMRDAIHQEFAAADLNLLVEQEEATRPEMLGRTARAEPPAFWQLAGHAEGSDIEKRLFAVQIELESSLPLSFASLSSYTVVYKVRGAVETLARYYPELQDRDFDTSMALCHSRYSTNTVSSFERTQPFALLGHNGEINTISRFRQEAQQINVTLPDGGSDSQDIDRALHTMCVDFGLDLIEAMELVFPPVPHEVEQLPHSLREIYTRVRQAYGPYAQGPAGVVARYGNIAACSLDALGLRPLWFVETEKEYIISSERGAIPLESMVSDPRALAPGEKMALHVRRGQTVDVLTHNDIRQHVLMQTIRRETLQTTSYWPSGSLSSSPGMPLGSGPISRETSGSRHMAPQTRTNVATALDPQILNAIMPDTEGMPWFWSETAHDLTTALLAAAGWQREHEQEINSLASNGKDLVGSLGHDGPLAVLSQNRVNIADFYKETVAVVTNPSIDRGREGEAFSTSTLVGVRPDIDRLPDPDDLLVSLATPLLPGGHPSLGSEAIAQDVARELGTLTIEELITTFEGRCAWLTLGVEEGETTQSALDRLANQAINAVRGGAQCLVLDDSETMAYGLGWLDPHLATGVIDEALRHAGDRQNLRRRAGIVVRSASIRTLHDIALICGFGADAINPYAMLGVALSVHKHGTIEEEDLMVQYQVQLLEALRAGLEKVISTIGCHELRGYGRVCSSIGLSPSVAKALATPNFLGSETVGLTWERLNQEAEERAAEIRGESAQPRLAKVDRFYPKFWKTIERYAMGEIEYAEVQAKFRDLSSEIPVALRHLLDIRHISDEVDPATVDIGIGDYDLPVVISAMSFGSQGELSYKAYAEAAEALNIICVNGEGGELPEIMGKYKHNRGQQVASGRFGVNAHFLNSSAVIEIKIGQGAKPGEGGMLPGAKVTPQVADARHTPPYVPLLSPSNNHDLYSIEDLAQLIEELKIVNPEAKVSVKCPCVPGIGVIAVGVAKAGADIINLTGYDGATGAARKHALQYVGLPAEIGVIQSHRALIDAGIRHKVELWCDGGMKTGEDALKMILLGANRVGFATMAMVAIGCTICRKCNEGTCHVGITTHIKSIEEADEKGLPSFVPRHYDSSVERIVRVFNGIGQEMRELAAQLGANRLQDLVGRADLLSQDRWKEMVDLTPMLEPVPVKRRIDHEPGVGRLLTRPRNHLSRFITELVVNAINDGEREVTYKDEAMAYDRVLGSHLAGELTRHPEVRSEIDLLHLHFGPSSIGGNGFSAWVVEGMDVLVEGGAQDGVAKGASGGRVAVMKGLNHDGLRIDGSVGKSFAYGAQSGVLIVQGNADSRACIRLSGADVLFGGEITEPLDNSAGSLGTQANLKGFACEYMTSGCVVILGDPGPYAFAGMTGGVVYQRLTPEMGLDVPALQQRLARGANVSIETIEDVDIAKIREMLEHYIESLERTDQPDVAERMRRLSEEAVLKSRFVKVVPILM